MFAQLVGDESPMVRRSAAKALGVSVFLLRRRAAILPATNASWRVDNRLLWLNCLQMNYSVAVSNC